MSRRGRIKRGNARVYTKMDAAARRHAAGKTPAGAESPKTARGMASEVAGYTGDFLAAPLQNGVIPNPDDIMMTLAPGRLSQYQRLSTDPYQLHRMMRRSDLKYKSLIQTRKNGVLAKEWQVLPNASDPDQARAADVAEFVRSVLTGLGNFHADLEDLLDAIPMGFAVSEIMWEQRTISYGDGLSRDAWVPVDLRQRRQGRFGFAEDWSLRYQETAGRFVEVPAAKFVVHTHGRENDARHGTAECSEVFWAWFMKHHFVKWWAVYGEKFGMPTAVAKYPQHWDDTKKQKLKAVIAAIQTEYGIVIPAGATIEFLEAAKQGTGSNTYQQFVEWLDKCLSEALTGQSLATGQGQAGRGSYSQSQTHADVKQEYIEADAKELMATINPQLVRPIVDINFGTDVPAPAWVIAYEARDLTGDLEADLKLINDAGLPLSETYFYEKYGRPVPADDEVLVRGRQGGRGEKDLTQRRGDAEDAEGGADADPDDDADDVKKEKPNKEKNNRAREGTRGPRKMARGPREMRADGATVFAVGKSGNAEARRKRDELDSLQDMLVEGGVAVFGRLGDLVADEADDAASLTDLRERVHGLSAALETRAELSRELVKAKVNGYLFAAAQNTRYTSEVLASEGIDDDGEHNTSFARARTFAAADLLADYEPLDPAKAVEWFESLVPLTKAELDNLPREAAGSAFTVADIETHDALQRVQDLINKYLNSGGTLEDWRVEYQEARKSMGLDEAENYRADALFRSETARAYGAGRTRALRDPEIESAFPLWQYIAIHDDRTRVEHLALDGFVAAPDDTVWLSKTPPWDYNCRCDLIPLSRRQIETRGIEVKPTVTMPDGTEVDPRGWPTSPGYRGVGFAAGG